MQTTIESSNTGSVADGVTADYAYSVFVQPGCSSCLRTKEFLARHGIAFRVVDVMNDPSGMAQLAELGVRHVPIIARGSEYAYGQDIDDVARFVGVDLPRLARLAPDVLVRRWDAVLEVAQACAEQLPDDVMDDRPIPNRAGSIRSLAYHVFRIPQAFLDVVERGVGDWIENSMQGPPIALRSGSDVASYGGTMRDELARWWRSRSKPVEGDVVRTFQGEQSMHWFLERSTWHSAQHARQIEDLLRRLGITPRQPFSSDILAGLPLPARIWE